MNTSLKKRTLYNAPINLKRAGGAGEAGPMGWGFDIFQNFGVKFPTHGQTIPVKCTKKFPTPGGILLSTDSQAGRKKEVKKTGRNKIP